MNHDEASRLLGAYRDGELDLTTCLKLEEHLAGCPDCQKKMEGERTLVELIQSEAPRFKASPFLKTRIQAVLREEKSSPAADPFWKPFSSVWLYFGSVGAAVVLAFFAVNIFWNQAIPSLDQEAVANHVRSLQVNHLMDVASTDQHTVKPWFAGKLDFSPQVVDLTASGYPLIGGRLDVLDHRYVAAIIYQRRKHYINLFVWPSDASAIGDRAYERDGYHVIGWTQNGMNYLAVSELGVKELKDFTGMIKGQIVPPLE